MTERAVVFRCEGDELVGILHSAQLRSSSTGVLIVVGGPQYRVGSHRQFVLIARRLAEHGVPVFRFDYRGMGDSDGQPRTFESVASDIGAAVDAFVAQVSTLRRVVLLGLCDAASAVCMYVPQDRRVGGLVLINPWVRTYEGQATTLLRYHYARRLRDAAFWRKVFSGEISMRAALGGALQSIIAAFGGGADVQPTAQFVGRMLQGFESFSGPILLLLSGDDLTAREFETLCRSSARWQTAISRRSVGTTRLVGADHTFSSTASLGEAVDAIRQWLDRWPPGDCELRPTPVGRR